MIKKRVFQHLGKKINWLPHKWCMENLWNIKINIFSIYPMNFRDRYKKLSNVWMHLPYILLTKEGFRSHIPGIQYASMVLMYQSCLKYKKEHFSYSPRWTWGGIMESCLTFPYNDKREREREKRLVAYVCRA